ncbi:hypothetical protein KYLE_28 [Pantoea phage Kyle]|uniref:Uncharacterized protein n=1 Tax=Pantoea phage Kyle TaxID=2589665 RepID=A0A514A8L6_9CAUD|nr:hypothetical protein HWC52_gp028 [Pantoea phage Kyle]QDH49611.1 hypothetical protein KYLE_28 [Pantoea phage Kyle]
MKEQVSIVFVVVARGHSVFQILGTFVDENTANAVRNANAELWVSCTVEPWVLDYSDAAQNIVEAVMGKRLVKQDAYKVGDMLAFSDRLSRGYGEVEHVNPNNGNPIYSIVCEAGSLTHTDTGWVSDKWATVAMYHDEITGVAK